MTKTFAFASLVPIALAAGMLTGCTSDKETVRSTTTTVPTTASTPSTAVSGTQGDETTTTDGSATTSTSTAIGAGSGCYVHLFDEDHFDERERNFRLTKPGRYADLHDLPGANHDWTDEADSIRVGPDATVTIWPRTNFEGQPMTLDPGTEHPDLMDEPRSLELTC